MNGKVYVYFNKRKFEQEGVKKYYVGQTSRTIKARAGKDGIRYIKNSETRNHFFKHTRLRHLKITAVKHFFRSS